LDCFRSAKGAKCESLGQRPRTGVSSLNTSAESAKSKESETKDMPQSLSSILIHLIFSTKHREPFITPAIESEFSQVSEDEYDERYVWD
jgi:hypothetical protein